MIRAATLVWLGVTGAVAFGVFMVAYEVRHLKDELGGLNREIGATEEAIHVLNAEWSYLNRPERLAMLAARHLELEPVAGSQMVTLDSIPAREDAAHDGAPNDEFLTAMSKEQ